MTKDYRFSALVKETITQPIGGFATLRRLPWTPKSALDLVLLIIALSVLTQHLAVLAINATSETPVTPILVSPGPMADAGFTAALNAFLIIGIWVMGRIHDRSTSLVDVAVMYAWFQLLMIGAQIFLIPVSLALPPIGALLAVMLAIFAQPYYLVCGVMSVHGFKQPLSVLGGLLLVGLVTAMLLGPVMLLLGIELVGLTNV